MCFGGSSVPAPPPPPAPPAAPQPVAKTVEPTKPADNVTGFGGNTGFGQLVIPLFSPLNIPS